MSGKGGCSKSGKKHEKREGRLGEMKEHHGKMRSEMDSPRRKKKGK